MRRLQRSIRLAIEGCHRVVYLSKLFVFIGTMCAVAQVHAGTVTFSSPTASSTVATFSSSGTYSLTLTVSDGVLTSSRTVNVIALANIPPVIGACSAQGIGGTSIDVPVSFSTGTTGVSALQFDVMFPTGVSFNSVTAGAASNAAGKTVSNAAITGGQRFLIAGLNQTALGSGVLAILNVSLDPSLPSGTINLPASNIFASDPNANLAPSQTGFCGLVVTANKRPVITAINAPATVTLPGTALLTGVATDDGAPSPLTYTWSNP